LQCYTTKSGNPEARLCHVSVLTAGEQAVENGASQGIDEKIRKFSP